MTTSSSSPNPWEIWLVYLHFADQPQRGKVRPVVILDSCNTIIAAKITTAEPHDQFSYYELKKWKMEGLLKPSRVQTKPLFVVEPGDLLNGQPLGFLTEEDRISLNEALRAINNCED